jgi:Putative MetA-pathway of phenol degradation
VRPLFIFVLSSLVAILATRSGAQDLAPRAYLISPLHSNAVTLTYSFYDGGIFFGDALPVSNASAKVSVPSFSYYHSLGIFGRAANIRVSLPYAVAKYQGTVFVTETNVRRSGLLDANIRFAVNLKGGPAMSPKEFRSWQQKTLVGVSLTVLARTGQYDPTKLVNLGTNRWAFKPELGYSRRFAGRWLIDAYGAVWFFTKNPEFFSHNKLVPGVNAQTQSPIAAFEGHLSYNIGSPRFWVSLDGNYWRGGSTSLNGKPTPGTTQANSRIGATASIPLNKHQSLKFSYNRGAYIRFGGDYQNVQIAWQYSWVGKPK